MDAKYTFIAQVLDNKLVKVTNTRFNEGVAGTPRECFGTFNNFNDHINLGLSLKNVIVLEDGKVYPSCIIADVEIRNQFSLATYEHICELQANNTVRFTSYGFKYQSMERIPLCIVDVVICDTAK
jgi:hypothetical protein